MKIIYDRTYLGSDGEEMLSLGYATLDYHSIRLRFEYTEAECEQNRALAPCRDGADLLRGAQMRSEEIRKVVEVIAGQYVCYQYDHREKYSFSSDSWDFFFWCNCFSQTMPGLGRCERDYSYVTLSFNEQHSLEHRKELCDAVLDLLREQFADHPHLRVAVQYQLRVDEARIARELAAVSPFLIGKPCTYDQMEGRIIENNGALIFLKKRSRKYGYRVSDYSALRIARSMGITAGEDLLQQKEGRCNE